MVEMQVNLLHTLRNLFQGEGPWSPALAEALRAYSESDAVRAALVQVKASEHAAASVSSLYMGYRTIVLERAGGWDLSLARLSREANTVARPTNTSVALCLESKAPVRFERYFDPADCSPLDVPASSHIFHEGHYFVGQGDVVVTTPGNRWAAPSGEMDCVWLKLDTPAVIPMSVAFDRATLLSVSVGFADENHTARDFFASLLLSLLQPTEALLGAMSASERAQLSAFVSYQAERRDTHLVTRWKYLQSLGRLEPAKAIAVLEDIARESHSFVGERARALLVELQAKAPSSMDA